MGRRHVENSSHLPLNSSIGNLPPKFTSWGILFRNFSWNLCKFHLLASRPRNHGSRLLSSAKVIWSSPRGIDNSKLSFRDNFGKMGKLRTLAVLGEIPPGTRQDQSGTRSPHRLITFKKPASVFGRKILAASDIFTTSWSANVGPQSPLPSWLIHSFITPSCHELAEIESIFYCPNESVAVYSVFIAKRML